ncbi:Bacterial leucyl aminopeptidase precursor [compost metagenome]
MTLFPGSGELVIGSMTDFTSAWLRDYVRAANDTYLHAKVVDDKCGYGCSDHASWYKNGYPAVMPFEATFKQSNQNIHTVKDVISPASNFKHSAVYSKLAVVMGMDLANSTARQP